VPAFIVVGLGVDATQALLISQVVLSFVLPVPMAALVYFTARRDIMGEFVTRPAMRWTAIAAAVVIAVFNLGLGVAMVQNATSTDAAAPAAAHGGASS
jgi:manganese transport protein